VKILQKIRALLESIIESPNQGWVSQKL